MAQVITNASVTIGGVDLSQHIRKVTLSTKRAELDSTTFGNTAKRRLAGLAENQISLDFNQDFSASTVEASVFSLLGTTTTVVIKPVSSTVSSTNPSYTMSVLVTEWTPLDVQVGDLASATITWPVDGSITKAVA
jgi:hypothetical protein